MDLQLLTSHPLQHEQFVSEGLGCPQSEGHGGGPKECHTVRKGQGEGAEQWTEVGWHLPLVNRRSSGRVG